MLFFDEFDALATPRDGATHSTVQSIVNTLLAELDGVNTDSDVLVVAATNRPEGIDPALTRSGRLSESLEVPPPDEAGRQAIFEIHTRDIPTSAEVTPEWFRSVTHDGMTGADIEAVVELGVREAIRSATDEAGQPELERRHVETALQEQVDDTSGVPHGFQ